MHFCQINFRIAGNFRGRKLLQISRVCGYLWKFSLWNLRAWRPLAQQKRQSAKVFSAKIVFFTNSRKFSPSKVSHYTVCTTKTTSILLTQQLVSQVFLCQRTVARLSLVWYKTILQWCVLYIYQVIKLTHISCISHIWKSIGSVWIVLSWFFVLHG